MDNIDFQLGGSIDLQTVPVLDHPARFPFEMPKLHEAAHSDIPVKLSEREAGVVKAKHNHYYKDVSNLQFVDVYRVLQLFNVTDPCIQHAVKKLLVAGGRGAGKDITKDVQESIDSLKRWQEMRSEENHD
jgi:hypothetical protein